MRTVRSVGLMVGALVLAGAVVALSRGPSGAVESVDRARDSDAPENEVVRGWELPRAAGAKAQAIREEIEALGPHPWAGEYICGDGLGMNVSILIAPTSGVVFTWRGCLGLYGWNAGSIKEVKDDRIVLNLDRIADGSFTEFLSSTLYRVQWGGRHYLVPVGEMQSFCEDARRRAWPFDKGRSSQYPLRESEREAELHGDPPIPPPYDRLMLPEPIRGTVVRVGEPERFFDTRWEQDMWRVRLEIDKGSASGLFEGLTLFPPGVHWHANAAVITELTDETGVLWIESTANRPSVEIGTVYSSRPTSSQP